MKQVCNCGRPDLHYKFEFGKCPVPNQESMSWSERFDRQFAYPKNGYENLVLKSGVKDFISKELESERQKVKEEVIKKALDLLKKHQRQNTYEDNERAVYATTMKEVIHLITNLSKQ